MSDTTVLDLTAEDITAPTWDELTRTMLGDEPGYDPTIHASSCVTWTSCTVGTCTIVPVTCTSG